LAALVLCASLAQAWAKESTPVRSTKGRIVASGRLDRNVATAVESIEGLVASLAGTERTPTAIKSCCDGAWRLHLAAVFDRPAGGDKLFLTFTEKDTDARVFGTEISVKPGDAGRSCNDLVIGKELGFAAGQHVPAGAHAPRGRRGARAR
jgi:hypothetical protein